MGVDLLLNNVVYHFMAKIKTDKQKRIDFISSQIRENRIEHHFLKNELKKELESLDDDKKNSDDKKKG